MFNFLVAILSLVVHVPAWALGKELVVGLQPTEPVRALIARHDPLAAHLRRELERPVRLVSARNTRVFGQRLLRGEYELALASAHLARLAQLDRAAHPIVRHEPHVPLFLLALDLATDPSPASLKNRRLAVPDDAFLAAVAGQAWLAGQQLLPKRDYALVVTGSYASTVHALVAGQADMAIGVLGGIVQARPEDIDRLRIVREIGTIPQLVFVARHDVGPGTRAALQRALLSFRLPPPHRSRPATPDDLADMDVYLPETRARLALPGTIPP